MKPHPSEASKLLKEVSKAVVGKESEKELLLVALLSGGHVLIEGMPGTAKTLLAKTFAKAIGGEFKRIQFTPDMLPSDITGFYYYTPSGEAKLVKGPAFTNILLADELNRATPRTQAALLEAMQENQVTIEGVTHPLPQPFLVVASQLPYGAEGTYPLTETQVDRFMLRAWSPYPKEEDEKEVLKRIDEIDEVQIEPVLTPKQVAAIQSQVREVYVSEEVVAYIVSLVNTIRRSPDVLLGPSPRGSIALYKGARALAYLNGRDYVIPDDVKKLAHPALVHRIKLKPEAEVEGATPRDVVEKALKETPVVRV